MEILRGIHTTIQPPYTIVRESKFQHNNQPADKKPKKNHQIFRWIHWEKENTWGSDDDEK